jgi:hypothetical protein
MEARWGRLRLIAIALRSADKGSVALAKNREALLSVSLSTQVELLFAARLLCGKSLPRKALLLCRAASMKNAPMELREPTFHQAPMASLRAVSGTKHLIGQWSRSWALDFDEWLFCFRVASVAPHAELVERGHEFGAALRIDGLLELVQRSLRI